MASNFRTVSREEDSDHEGKRRGQASGWAQGQPAEDVIKQLRQKHRHRQALRAALSPLDAAACFPADTRRRHSGAPLRCAVARGRFRQARAAQQHPQIFRRREPRATSRSARRSRRRSRTSGSRAISRRCSAPISSGTYLRIEFAQDIDGFWLEPHTDLGVKVFTMLLYLSKDPSHQGSRHRYL